MPLLVVDAQAATGVAADGNAGAAFALVSVLNSDGTPISLDEDEFRFSLVDPGTRAAEPMTHVFNGAAFGGTQPFSLFRGAGTPGDRWQAGEYFVVVYAKSPAGNGQSIAYLRIP